MSGPDRTAHLQAVLGRNLAYSERALREMHRAVHADLEAVQAELTRSQRRLARSERRLGEVKERLRLQRQRSRRLRRRLRSSQAGPASPREQTRTPTVGQAVGRTVGQVRAVLGRAATRLRGRRG